MQALSGAAWLVAGRLGGDTLALALFVLVAREFGPAGTGLFAFHFALATILYELVSLGVEEYGVREYARRSIRERNALLNRLCSAQALLALLAVCVALMLALASGRVHVPLLLCVVTYQLAFAVARTLFMPAFVAGRVGTQVLAETAVRAAVLGVALWVTSAASAPTLTTLLVGLPIFGALLLAFAAVSARRYVARIAVTFSPTDVASVLREVWPFAGASFMSALYTRTPLLLLFILAGSDPAGLFASAYKLAELGWALLAFVPAAAYPHLARLTRARPLEARTYARRMFGITLASGAVLAWGTYWLAPLVVPALLGAAFAETAPLLQVFATFVAAVAVAEGLERLLLLADLQVHRFRVAVVQVIVNLALGFVLTVRFGAFGAALALIVAQIVTAPMLLLALRDRLEVADTRRCIATYTLALAAGVAAAAVTASLSQAPWLPAVSSLGALLFVLHAGGLVRASPAASPTLARVVR